MWNNVEQCRITIGSLKSKGDDFLPFTIPCGWYSLLHLMSKLGGLKTNAAWLNYG